MVNARLILIDGSLASKGEHDAGPRVFLPDDRQDPVRFLLPCNLKSLNFIHQKQTDLGQITGVKRAVIG